MLSGLVVDGDNKPISGAMIKINNLSVAEQAVSDQDGLYYSRLLPAGGYWVYVYVGGQRLKAGRIFLSASSGAERYYNIKVAGDKASLMISDHDPFATAYLQKVKGRPMSFDVLDGPNTAVLMLDASQQPKYRSTNWSDGK